MRNAAGVEPTWSVVRLTDMKKVLIPLAAAVAVVVLFVGVRALMSPTDDSPGTPPVAGGGSEPSGSAVPGDPGSSPAEPPPGTDPSPPQSTNPMAVVIDSFYKYDGRRLAINYTIGVPECYGTIAPAKVVETEQSVSVTLTRIPPKDLNKDTACIEIALLKSVDITLETPLGDRTVLDGSFDSAEVRPGSAPADKGGGQGR